MKEIRLKLGNDFKAIDTALFSPTKYVTIHAGRRCFAGDTLVHVVGRYERIDQIHKGEMVYSFNMQTKRIDRKKVLNVYRYGGNKTKPMLELKWLNCSIRCTYDHKILSRKEDEREERWIPAFIYAWRRMDSHTRDRLQILCEQYGEDINYELQVYGQCEDNDSCVRWEWLSANHDSENGWEISYNQDAQNGCLCVCSESPKQKTDQSQKRSEDRQQSRKLRMDDSSREYGLVYETWKTNKELWRKVWYSYTDTESSKRDKEESKRAHKCKKCGKINVRKIQSKMEYNSGCALWENLEVSLIDSIDTYDLEIEDNHSYLITKNNFIVHNSGKTYNAVRWLYAKQLEEKCGALWIDTVQRNIDKYVDRYFQVIAGDLWPYIKFDAQHKILTLPNGSFLDFGSAERPELLEGFEYKYTVINEAGIALKKAGLWDNVIAPMTKGKDSKTRIIGTPKGRNMFHTLAQYGISGQDEWKDYHFSAYDSPYWDNDELDVIKKRVPEIVWKQEYLADFIEGEGSVFRNMRRCYSTELITEGVPGHRYVMSADLAKHQDFTVIMVVDAKTRQVVFMDRFNQIDWVIQKRRIVDVFERFFCPKLVIDSTGIGDTILDDLRDAGLRPDGLRFTAEIKRELIQDLTVAIDSQKIYFYPFPELISELELFEYNVSPQGNISYSAPEGFHDDCVVSLALILYGLDKYQNKGETVHALHQVTTEELLRKTYESKGDQMPNVYAELIKRQLRR